MNRPTKPECTPAPRELDARTPVTTYSDGTFVRTALVVGNSGSGGQEGSSIDVLDSEGTRLAQINVFLGDDGALMVDVIDVDDRYPVRRALAFPKRKRKIIDNAGPIVVAHFERAAGEQS